jgi:uncharacterized repeat protein (TIGR01451 family)
MKVILFTIFLLVSGVVNSQYNTVWASTTANIPSKSVKKDQFGNFYVLADIATGGTQIYKFNSSGFKIWTRVINIFFNNCSNGIVDVSGSVCTAKFDIDQQGNIIIAATFTGILDVDPGPSILNFNAQNTYANFFVEKLDSSGSLVWAKHFTGDRSYTHSLKVTKNNKIVIVGNSDGLVDFDPGPAIVNSNSTSGNSFILELNNDGSFSQIKRFGDVVDRIFTEEIQVDSFGNLILIGVTAAAAVAVDYDPGIGTFYLPYVNTIQMFVMKVDKNYNFKWAKALVSPNSPSSQTNKIYTVATDLSGNVFLGGRYDNVLDCDPGPNNFILSSNGMTRNFFLIKLDSDGAFQFAKTLEQSPNNSAYTNHITVDTSSNIYIGGAFYGRIDFDPGIGVFEMASSTGSPGGNDGFLLKLDYKGDFLWARKFGALNDQEITSICIIENHIVITGAAGYQLYFDNGSLITYEDFIAKIADLNNIQGYTFFDANSNGIKDPGEFNLPSIELKATRPSKSYFSMCDSLGFYNILVDTGTYSITIPNLPLYYSSSIPTTHIAIFGNRLGKVDTGNIFGLVPIANKNDLKITLTNTIPARAGRGVGYRIFYKNVGTTIQNGTINLKYSGIMNFSTATPIPSSNVSQNLSWNFANLKPLETRGIDVYFSIPTTATINTNLQNIASINSAPSDESPSNNADTLNHNVIASFDPNDKAVLPLGNILPSFISAGKYLDYTIRFQNTGNDTAFNIIIKDTLDKNLDISSFEFIGASHRCEVFLKDSGKLEFRFFNILLPDSNVNEVLSHGFVRFKIKPLTSLIIGDKILNKAYILFDFNEAVITNQTNTIVTTATAINPLAATNYGIKYFPNPVDKILTIDNLNSLDKWQIIEIREINGKQVLVQPIANRTTMQLNVGMLSKGMYVGILQKKDGVKTYFKFIKN